jgi:hypothetical protein
MRAAPPERHEACRYSSYRHVAASRIHGGIAIPIGFVLYRRTPRQFDTCSHWSMRAPKRVPLRIRRTLVCELGSQPTPSTSRLPLVVCLYLQAHLLAPNAPTGKMVSISQHVWRASTPVRSDALRRRSTPSGRATNGSPGVCAVRIQSTYARVPIRSAVSPLRFHVRYGFAWSRARRASSSSFSPCDTQRLSTPDAAIIARHI